MCDLVAMLQAAALSTIARSGVVVAAKPFSKIWAALAASFWAIMQSARPCWALAFFGSRATTSWKASRAGWYWPAERASTACWRRASTFLALLAAFGAPGGAGGGGLGGGVVCP